MKPRPSFWKDSDYALKTYVSPPPTAALIRELETELGYRLPAAYIALMKTQNGGIPRDSCFPVAGTSWAEDHVAISGIHGIGRNRRYSLGGQFGSQFWIDMWNYPALGIYFGSCPSAGHDMILLDYRECGPQGEPSVVHVDQGRDFKITHLADNFADFIAGLQNESVYDTSEEDLADDKARIKSGSFSPLLAELVDNFTELDAGAALRALCLDLTKAKGYFALHADRDSHFIYDVQFLLYSHSHRVASEAAYLETYPNMIALGEGEFSTGGYAPGFVEDWLEKRIADGDIERTGGGLALSPVARSAVVSRLSEI